MKKGWKIFLWLVLIVGLCVSGWLWIVPAVQQARYQASITELEVEIVKCNPYIPEILEIVKSDGEKITLHLKDQRLYNWEDKKPFSSDEGFTFYKKGSSPGLREFLITNKGKPLIYEDVIYVEKIGYSVHYRLKYAGVGEFKKMLEIELIRDIKKEEIEKLASNFKPTDVESWILKSEHWWPNHHPYVKIFRHSKDYAEAYAGYDIPISKEKPILKRVVVVWFEIWKREVWVLDKGEWRKIEEGWTPKARQI